MNQFEDSKAGKNSEIPGRIIRPGGADNPAPSKFFPKHAAAHKLIDREKKIIQHDL
jgi:hypothetical protein